MEFVLTTGPECIYWNSGRCARSGWSGGTGRRSRLKICRRSPGVGVQLPPPAPASFQYISRSLLFQRAVACMLCYNQLKHAGGLKLYRRHPKDCEGRYREELRSGEFEEGRRGWKRCRCLIHAAGTLVGKFNRKPTGKLTGTRQEETRFLSDTALAESLSASDFSFGI